MSSIYICDRCDRTSLEFKIVRVKLPVAGRVGYPDERGYDLCLNCVNALIEFVEKKVIGKE